MPRFLIVGNTVSSLVGFRSDLIADAIARGWEVHAAAGGISRNPSGAGRLRAMGTHLHEIPVDRAGTNPLADLRMLRALYRLMREVRPDVVLGYTIKPVIYGTVAAWLARVPHRFALMSGLGYAFTNGREGALQRLICRMYGFALRRAEGVFFQNPDDVAVFRGLDILPSRIRATLVNGSGVNLQQFQSVDLPAGSIRFLLVARLLGDKGVREYVAAARRLREKYPDVHCVLVGGLDANPDSIKQAELDGWVAEGVVDYRGKLGDVRPAIAACSVSVLPSYYREGVPRSLLEAMSMGRPVITTDAPGCRETVEEGVNGFLVPPKSVDALVAAMTKFIEQPGLVERMGRASRRMAEERFDVRKVNAVMLQVMGVV